MAKKLFKYPKIKIIGHDENRDLLAYPEDHIMVESKIDGGNFSFFLDDEGVINECSRNRNLTTDEDEKTFIKQRLWLRDKLKDKKIDPDYVYYCEVMAKHTINYTIAPDMVGFDIRLRHDANSEGLGVFIDRVSKEEEFKRLGIECVPLVWEGTAGELKKLNLDDMIPKSIYYDGLEEGICIKSRSRLSNQGNRQLMGKKVRILFKEKNKAIFGGFKQKYSDTNKIVDVFCTEARIKKIILKCVNEEGLSLELALMSKVPHKVIKDILAEEFCSIFDKYKFIDFKQFKQLAGKRCLYVLSNMISEGALE